MTNTSTNTKKKKKRSNLRKKEIRARILFIILLLVILIPAGIFGWMLLSAWLDTGSPILGDRYKDDLDPAITKSDIETIEKSTGKLTGVEKASVQLATATLRVYADITDSSGVETAESTADSIYRIVAETLDPSVYFAQSGNKKMYDLEIHVYNDIDKAGTESYAYVIETKTSSMSEPIRQVASQPVDAELAQQLRDAVEARNNPQPAEENREEQNQG